LVEIIKMKAKLIFFTVYIIYLVYYYLTREHFFDRLVQTTIIFGVVAIGYFIYFKFYKDKAVEN